MLRLKLAINECGIPQQSVVKATGFSKTQVSLSLNKGVLPVNEEKFKAGVVELVRDSRLREWLQVQGMNVERLFEDIGDPNDPTCRDGKECLPDLNELLYNLAGRVTLDGGLSREIGMRLVRATHFLSMTVRPEMAREAATILHGGGE